MHRYRSLFAVCSLVVILFGTGCASYQLGPTSGQVAGAQSITLIPFPNQTPEPSLSPYVASAMRRQIQSDGTFTLDTKRQGDIIVTGNIISYQRVGVSFQPGDIITVRDFELRMSAQIKAVNRRSRKVILDKAVTGTTIIRAFNDLASSERQALPLLAEDLARRATDLLVDGEW
jgi:hypothetical protein